MRLTAAFYLYGEVSRRWVKGHHGIEPLAQINGRGFDQIPHVCMCAKNTTPSQYATAGLHASRLSRTANEWSPRVDGVILHRAPGFCSAHAGVVCTDKDLMKPVTAINTVKKQLKDFIPDNYRHAVIASHTIRHVSHE